MMKRISVFHFGLVGLLATLVAGRAQVPDKDDPVAQMQEQQRKDYERARASAPRTDGQVLPDAAAPYRDETLPYSQRADDLISRMTLNEKIELMNCSSKAMPQYGIPPFSQFRECLHGITPELLSGTSLLARNPQAKASFHSTVYPEPITTSASWDLPLVHKIGREISNEARGAVGGLGSSFFAPNVNIFRDPRWGRGQETPGEDPYLTGRYAVAFITGLQGDDPIHAESLGCAKHFAVHSGPEAERFFFNVDVSPHDLYETYLPGFEAAVREAKVGQIMSAYNAVNGVPASLSPLLLTEVLRNQWNFDGDVITDAGALNQTSTHFDYDAPLQNTALAVNAGLDTDIGSWFRYLPNALKQGLITVPQINLAVKHRLMLLYRLGRMDRPALDPYASIPASVVDSEEHRATARQAAREGIVLLKNDNHTLPLAKNLARVAVIGPLADHELLGNYHGVPSKAVTIAQGLAAVNGGALTIRQVAGTKLDEPAYPDHPEPLPLAWLSPAGVPAEPHATQGIWARYYNARTPDLAGETDKRVETTSTFRLFADGAPKNVQPRNFSAVWETTITPPDDALLLINADPGSKVTLEVDGKTMIRTLGWTTDRIGNDGGTSLKGGVAHRVRFTTTSASFKLLTSPPMHLDFSQALAAAVSSDAVVLSCGIPHSYEDESNDRLTTQLPWDQLQMIQAVTEAAGRKPVVLVVASGSSVAMPWAAEHVPAIVWCGQGGEEAGGALADVLFGDFNPAGRLPVTFYAGDDQLPLMEDYRMDAAPGRTYRYFTGKPRWEFGEGLSYTTFAYGQPVVTPLGPTTTQDVTLSVKVKNTGSTAGAEVCELYLSHPDSPAPAPLRSLAGFERLNLKPGEERTVSFTLTPQQLSVVDPDGKRLTRPGKVLLHVGSNQHDGLEQSVTLAGDQVVPVYRMGQASFQ